MASRQTFLMAAILAITMPSFVKGQNFTFNITKAHELFDEDLYTLASDVVKNNHSELNLNQMNRLLNVARALDADLGNKIRNLTGLTQTNSTELEIALRQGMEDRTIQGITVMIIRFSCNFSSENDSFFCRCNQSTIIPWQFDKCTSLRSSRNWTFNLPFSISPASNFAWFLTFASTSSPQLTYQAVP